MKRRRGLLPRLGLVVAGILLSVLALELGMRGAGWFFDRARRQHMESRLPAAGELRILCLGESMTEGDPWHVRYPESLQQILDGQPIDGEVTVINGGVGGIRTDGILADLEQNLERYRPQIVVSMMGINDRGQTHAYGTIIAPGEGRWYGSMRVYKLYRVLRVALERRLGVAGGDDLVAAGDVAQLQAGTSFDTAQSELSRGSTPPSDEEISQAISAADAMRQEGRFDEAEALLRRLVEDRPDNVGPVIELSLHLAHVGQYERSHEVLLDRYTSMSDPPIAILEALAVSYGNLEQWDESIAILVELRHHYTAPDDRLGQAHFAGALANAYESAGRLQEAEDCLLEISERLQPGDDAALDALIEFYERHGRGEEAARSRELQLRIRHEYVNPITRRNYQRLLVALDARDIEHVAVQYPMRRIESLERLLGHDPRPLYVDLHFIAEFVERDGYETYFIDRFAGDFGHLTDLGNVLMAEKIARVIVEDILGRTFNENWRQLDPNGPQ